MGSLGTGLPRRDQERCRLRWYSARTSLKNQEDQTLQRHGTLVLRRRTWFNESIHRSNWTVAQDVTYAGCS
jgi:hypothetical protein